MRLGGLLGALGLVDEDGAGTGLMDQCQISEVGMTVFEN